MEYAYIAHIQKTNVNVKNVLVVTESTPVLVAVARISLLIDRGMIQSQSKKRKLNDFSAS